MCSLLLKRKKRNKKDRGWFNRCSMRSSNRRASWIRNAKYYFTSFSIYQDIKLSLCNTQYIVQLELTNILFNMKFLHCIKTWMTLKKAFILLENKTDILIDYLAIIEKLLLGDFLNNKDWIPQLTKQERLSHCHWKFKLYFFQLFTSCSKTPCPLCVKKSQKILIFVPYSAKEREKA